MNEEKVETIAEQPAKETPKAPKEDPSEKRIQELEAELGRKAKELGDQKEFIEQANVVINTVAYNPELKSKFQEVYQRAYGVPAEQQEKEEVTPKIAGDVDEQSKRLNQDVAEIKASSREEKVAEFEKRFGISSLPDDEKKKIRSEIGTYLSDFGQNINTVPLTKLPTLLERTYMSIKAKELKEEGRLEGVAEARENAYGTLNTMPSGSINEPAGGLTPKQADVAKKLGVDPEKVAESWKKAQQEGEI
jgi:hypothetical protein